MKADGAPVSGKVKMLRKEFGRYIRERYPEEAATILQKADALFPVLRAKAPDIGGAENLMAYNLDMMILSAAFYEASDRRIDGGAVTEIAERLFRRCGFIGKLINLNRPWQMKLFRSVLYKRYVPYARLADEKLARGEWGNSWRVKINPRNTDQGLCFELVGCPLADFTRANGYEELLPSLCATDHMLAALLHAKLIRTHTCATGSGSCDYWYVADRSETAGEYADVKMV